MSKSLLEKAKKIDNKKIKSNATEKEMQELSLAWVKNEISLSQIASVLGIKGTGHQCYAKIAHSLKKYINNLTLL